MDPEVLYADDVDKHGPHPPIGVCIILSIVALVLSYFAFREKYVNAAFLLFAIMATVFAISSFIRYRRSKTLGIYPDELQVIYKAGNRVRIIPRNSINGWSEVLKTSRNSNWNELRIYSPKGVVKIRSDEFENYESLKERLTEDIPRDLRRERRIKGQWVLGAAISCILLGLFFFCEAISSVESQNLTASDVMTISGVTTNRLQLKTHKGNAWINIDFPDYPEPGFIVSGDYAHSLEENGFLTDVRFDDTLWIDLRKSDYLTAVTHQRPASFLERIFGFSRIHALGVKTNKHIYYAPTFTDPTKSKDDAGINGFNVLAWSFLILGIIVFGIWYRILEGI